MIQAINEKVVAILLKRETTAGGLIIPEIHQEPQAFCKVMSVGKSVTSVKEGDIIVSHIRGGMDVVIEKNIIKVLKEEEIYGILTDRGTLDGLAELRLEASKPTPESKIIQV